jgi:hypothetical protein
MNSYGSAWHYYSMELIDKESKMLKKFLVALGIPHVPWIVRI